VTSPTPPSAEASAPRSPVFAGVGTKKCSFFVLHVAAAAVTQEQRFSAILLPGEVLEIVAHRSHAGAAIVVSRLVGHQGADKLSKRIADPLPGNLTIAEGALEKLRIGRVARERLRNRTQVLPHLDMTRDRHHHGLLQAAGALVPEEPRPLVITEVDERHRTPVGVRPLEAPADGLRFRKGMRLNVTGPAGR